MAHSLEARPPLLDHRLVEFAATIPAKFRLRGGTTKYLFKQAMRGMAAGRHHRPAEARLRGAARAMVSQGPGRVCARPAAVGHLPPAWIFEPPVRRATTSVESIAAGISISTLDDSVVRALVPALPRRSASVLERSTRAVAPRDGTSSPPTGPWAFGMAGRSDTEDNG